MKVLKPGTIHDLPTSSNLNWSIEMQVKSKLGPVGMPGKTDEASFLPAMSASIRSCRCSDFMRSSIMRAAGIKRFTAIMRIMFSVSSCLGSTQSMLGNTKNAVARIAAALVRSAASSALPVRICTCGASETLSFCFRNLMALCTDGLPLGRMKTAWRSSASSAWSGWKSSAMKSITTCAGGFPVTTMCLVRSPGSKMPPPLLWSDTTCTTLWAARSKEEMPPKMAMMANMRPRAVSGARSPYPTVETVAKT
mmetsp:Transcript_17952/g.38259  ORF Transcript_17952/g.38259 Transcript_17952/m.38259 type:complete len:251 (+) Transcript_17952:1693-2445(+)